MFVVCVGVVLRPVTCNTDSVSGGSKISRWGVLTRWGAPTSDMGAFWWKHMQK